MLNDEECIKECYKLAEKSYCLKKKVGCLIVADGEIVGTGYNCIPGRNCDCAKRECYQRSKDQCLMVIHAEHNAIIDAVKKNVDFSRASLYVNLSPCIACARLLYSVGIRKVFFAEKYSDYKGLDEDYGEIFLTSLGVEMTRVELGNN